MRAYKFTDPQACGMFTGFQWPQPAGDEPGAWVRTPEDLRVCVAGVHACRTAHVPYWLGAELWEIELAGEVIEAPHKLVASAGRLTRRIDGWPDTQAAFADDCAARTLELATAVLRGAGCGALADAALDAAGSSADLQAVALAAADAAPVLAATLIGYALDCALDIDNGYHSMCAYVAATAFANHSTGDTVQDMTSDGWAQERARQASWLADRLGLRDGD